MRVINNCGHLNLFLFRIEFLLLLGSRGFRCVCVGGVGRVARGAISRLNSKLHQPTKPRKGQDTKVTETSSLPGGGSVAAPWRSLL